MIKATARVAGGKPLLLLGLSRKNTELLLQGRPIRIELLPLLGIDGLLVITGGETEAAIEAELAPLIGPRTQIERPLVEREPEQP